MHADDIQRELDRLWERVTAPSEAAPPPPMATVEAYGDAPSITREVSMEAISLIKRQHRDEVLRLKQLIEIKERSISELTTRIQAADREVANLRKRNQKQEEEVYEQVMGTSAELEAAQKGFQAQEERYREEEVVLRSIAENTRKQLAMENARWRELERQWTEREQAYMIEIRELESRALRAQESAAQNEGHARKASSDLGEAKGAVESALGELLKERAEREEADKERDQALKRVREVEEHVQHLQNLWQEERTQWQELWDRERSTWESQRQEFSAWEEKARKDREAFHGSFQKIEESQTRHAGEMAELLRNTTKIGEKANKLFEAASAKAREMVQAPPALQKLRLITRRHVAAAVLALAVLAAIPSVRNYMNRLQFELVSSQAVDLGNPTGIAYDGDALWVSDWGGEIVSLDPKDPSRVVTRLKVEAKGPFHPVAVESFGDKLYSLDSAQGRVLRHAVGGGPSEAWPSPGPAPVALAHDGRNLWSYDGGTRMAYRHLGDGAAAGTEPYKIPLDIAPTAMSWDKEDLWIYDGKGKRVWVLKVKGKVLYGVRSQELDAAVADMTLAYLSDKKGAQRRELWILAVPESGVPAVKKYRVKP